MYTYTVHKHVKRSSEMEFSQFPMPYIDHYMNDETVIPIYKNSHALFTFAIKKNIYHILK